MISVSKLFSRLLFISLTIAFLSATSEFHSSTPSLGQIAAAQALPPNEFYVAPVGSNRNPGTEELPFRTIQYAVDRAGPGDKVIVRAGVYHEAVTVSTSGTSDAPLLITAYPGERPVIDGRYRLPGGEPARWNYEVDPPIYFVWGALVRIRGSHVHFTGFEVKRSLGRAVLVSNDPDNRNHDVLVDDCLVHDSRNSLLRVMDADRVTVTDCHFYHASDYATHSRTAPELNWPAALATINATDVVFRRNIVRENWSSGISPGVDSRNITVENNIIYDHLGQQVYIHRSQGVTLRNNLIYHSNQTAFQRGGDPSSCIAMNNELGFETAMTVSDVLIENNILVGCRRNLGIWRSEGSGMLISNVTIRNNTLVNATVNREDFESAGIFIAPGNLRNITIERNVILQNEGISGDAPVDPEIRYSRNLWSSAPVAAMQRPGDIIGTPKLVNADARLRPGRVDPAWYVPQPGSTAVVMELGAVAFYGENPPALPSFPIQETDEEGATDPAVSASGEKGPTAPGRVTAAPTPTPSSQFLDPSVYAHWHAIAATTRVTENLQLLYTFDEGEGAIIHDRSGHVPALDLVIDDEEAVSWQAAGLTVNEPATIASAQLPTRVVDACAATNEVTLETWIEPANLTQDGPARILTMSSDIRHRNFMLGQGLWGDQARNLFTARLRTTEQSLNGEPPLSTEAGTAQLEMTHLVFTHDASGTSAIYINGELQRKGVIEGELTNWDRDYGLLLANEEGGTRPWLGTYALVAVYCQALTGEGVNQNYASGSGKVDAVADEVAQ